VQWLYVVCVVLGFAFITSQSTSRAYADLPTVLTILHPDSTPIISLLNSCSGWLIGLSYRQTSVMPNSNAEVIHVIIVLHIHVTPGQRIGTLDKNLFEIHLLRLNLHDGLDKPVQCWLHTVSLQDRLSYTTVSYAWGDPGATAPIICNGTVTRVTKSLDSALRCIWARYSNSELETVVLWVDGLCISQQDISERANQVRIMDLIYQSAFSTIV
jgi:hypothetical protein